MSRTLPPVLDACCAGRLFWFDRADPRALFMDNRQGTYLKDLGTPATKGRKPLIVKPDVIADFTQMPFPDASFSLVVLDPPHHTTRRFNNHSSILRNSYGMLLPGWQEMLAEGLKECFRVLRPLGTLILKWCAAEIPLSQVLALTPQQPLFGHRSGKKAKTHWVAFLKPTP